MHPASKKPLCVGSTGFEPSTVATDGALQQQVEELLKRDDLLGASRILFKLPINDDYIYHATASVSLEEVQHIVQLGGVNGLHNWYKTSDGAPVSHLNGKPARRRGVCHLLTVSPTKREPPPKQDIDAYTSIFSPKTTTPSALKNFKTNARKDSIRLESATCLSDRSLQMLKILADGREFADMGSGNGYWSYMLRTYGLTSHPVDNMQSVWRVSWVDDTVISDGVKWLKRHDNGKQMVLLLVYPVVGGGLGGGKEGAFTRDLVNAYGGDTIAVVGTQNRNGYTGFKNMTMAEYMEREQPQWTKVVQISLPSFGGKDEALFVFQRDERAAKLRAKSSQ
ncbi:hypothetical protein PWT90_07932 [Aphanocladium album]|nr:hypothetical protein PWT90_07932 [Aphanocladium album]